MNSNRDTLFCTMFNVVLLSAAISLIGCVEKQPGNGSVDSEIDEPIQDVRIPTASDTAEAYDIALWYSNQLTPPDTLVLEIFNALWSVRCAFGDSIRYQDTNRILLNYRFIPSWRAGLIHIRVDDTTFAAVSNGTYVGWNNLEPSLRPTSVTPWNYVNTVFVRFNSKLHPLRIAEVYRTLPGVTFTEPRNCDYLEPEQIPIYPARTSNGWSFVFSRMQSSTYERTFYYFRVAADSVTYFGSHPNYATPPPAWFSEAKSSNIDIWCSWSQ